MCGPSSPEPRSSEPGRSPVRTIEWVGGTDDGCVRIIDQTLLPVQVCYRECRDIESVWEAIRALRVRGAPAIGIAAAMGLVLGVRAARPVSRQQLLAALDRAADLLRSSRPTAVNLFWALERMQRVARGSGDLTPQRLLERLLDEARAIEQEDRQRCRAIGRWGAELVPDGAGVLTHCNAGGLATADYGTALAVLFTAQERGKRFRVFVDETRPLLQGARLTTWELMRHDIPVTLICDNMAAHVMQRGWVQMVITGADRIAANGDTANKIGTYGLAVLARAHQVPFYVAAPASTFDLGISTGQEIPIEERDGRELTHGFGRQTAPDGVGVYNPAFDVTPARLIEAIVTDQGIIRPVTAERIRQVLG